MKKITMSDATEIRRLVASGMMQKDVAPLFGVSKGLVNQIVLGKIWNEPPTPEELFWSQVERGDESSCWMWRGALVRHGYGYFRYRGTIATYAHRYSYCLSTGMSVDGFGKLVIMHSCDNPGCVNPSHLRLATQTENVRDMYEKDRGAKGARRGHAKLNDDAVREIRLRYMNGEKQRVLAEEFGVNQSIISTIVTRKTWTHVP